IVFTVFPNPAKDFLQVDFTLFQSSNTVINLISIDGKTIRTLFDNQLAMGANKINLNVNDCKAGVYFLQINANNSTSYKKIIIQ
ncbi:MAG: T9SS type A sorting domain-containing protein, partial [Bacteroidia bacterium]|nr:T9SS type A sorting domain-containing protein [Bacteroidia bacterium]